MFISLRSGQTRLQSTTTEAESYMRLALGMDLFGGSTPFSRATTETYALDSYQNILFSIARFHEVTGRYPSQMTVVGYEMKRRRFEDLHRTAIRFPTAVFEYIGLEPPATADEAITARQGEVRVETQTILGFTLIPTILRSHIAQKWLSAIYA